MLNRTLALLFVLLILPASAQTVVVGSEFQMVNLGHSSAPPYTLMDLSHPASADGSLTSASVHWLGKGCTGAFKLKVVRPANTLSISSATLVAERGPFNAVPGRNQVELAPPVSVKKGDLIAITMLQPYANCGSVGTQAEMSASVMQVSGDFAVGPLTGSYLRDESLSVRATDTTEVLEGVITAAGSLQGGFGSYFRTSLQVVCPGGGTCTGTLVFHPAGVPASPGDQALPYTVSSGAGTSYTDVVDTMGKSGLGTIDVISNNGFPPVVTARIYNDAGPNGTSGFTEDMIPPAKALHFGDLAVLLTPADLTNFRVNVGVRTFSSPATINVQYGFRMQSNRDFPANTFQQFSLAGFGDTSPVPNEQIIFSMASGDAVIYLSITDNRTNDSSVRFAQRE